MSAPFRIVRASAAVRAAAPAGAAAGAPAKDDLGAYLKRLLLMIPAEVISLYLVGTGLIPADASAWYQTGWAVLCLGAVVLIRTLGTRDTAAHKPVDWMHVAISVVAFAIWVFTLGGPFAAWKIQTPSFLGSLLVLAWTFVVPVIYKGPQE